MIYFCPVCWKEISANASTCPYCSANILQADSRPFIEKLISALHHPEPETAARAAWILGQREEVQAVPELIHTVENAKDGFLVEAAAEALGKIGDGRALNCLRVASERGPVRVRIAGRKAVQNILSRTKDRGFQPKHS
jgi:HEAT repeat protein